MIWTRDVRGALIDLDGTLLDGGRSVAGAQGFLERLRSHGLAFKICSNITRWSRADAASALADAGLDVVPDDVLLPAWLAQRMIAASGRRRAMLLVSGACLDDFDGVARVDEGGDWVVVGDLGRDLHADRLDAAFRALRAGAGFLALHRNRFWHAGPERGWALDAGSYVAALEHATGATATVVGKPSRAFFELGLAELGLPAGQVVMIGDSIENDLEGAAAAGCKTAVVRGTAFSEEALRASAYRPDWIAESVAEL